MLPALQVRWVQVMVLPEQQALAQRPVLAPLFRRRCHLGCEVSY